MLRSAKVVFFLALLSLASSLSTFAASPVLIKGKVLIVSDGDTIQFQPNSTSKDPNPVKLKVRFKDIDTPEAHLNIPGGVVSQGIWADLATKQLQDLIRVGDEITVSTSEMDANGRTLGVLINRGVDVNEEMIRTG